MSLLAAGCGEGVEGPRGGYSSGLGWFGFGWSVIQIEVDLTPFDFHCWAAPHQLTHKSWQIRSDLDSTLTYSGSVMQCLQNWEIFSCTMRSHDDPMTQRGNRVMGSGHCHGVGSHSFKASKGRQAAEKKAKAPLRRWHQNNSKYIKMMSDNFLKEQDVAICCHLLPWVLTTKVRNVSFVGDVRSNMLKYCFQYHFRCMTGECEWWVHGRSHCRPCH